MFDLITRLYWSIHIRWMKFSLLHWTNFIIEVSLLLSIEILLVLKAFRLIIVECWVSKFGRKLIFENQIKFVDQLSYTSFISRVSFFRIGNLLYQPSCRSNRKRYILLFKKLKSRTSLIFSSKLKRSLSQIISKRIQYTHIIWYNLCCNMSISIHQ